MRIAGLARSKQIHGFDVEQARSLAAQFAISMMVHFEQQGWRYHNERGGERVCVRQLQPSSKRKL